MLKVPNSGIRRSGFSNEKKKNELTFFYDSTKNSFQYGEESKPSLPI